MANYGLIMRLQAQPNKGPDLAALLLQASEAVGKSDGCHIYMISHSAENQDSIQVIEVWDTKEAHDQSLALPEVKQLISQAMPLLAGPPQAGDHLQVLGGQGLPK